MNGQLDFDFDSEPLDEEPAVTAAPRESTASRSTLDRIRKLLRLAKDKAATPAEAEAAAQAACELATRHHVDTASLNLDEHEEAIIGRYLKAARNDRLAKGVRGVLRSYFHVETCFCGKTVLFVGRETAVAIAEYMWDFLVRNGRSACRAYEDAEKRQRRRMTTLKRDNFLAGFCWGLHSKLGETRSAMQLTDNQQQIVLVEEQARLVKLEELSGGTVQAKVKPLKRRLSAAGAGFIAGQATEINTPIGGKGRLALHETPKTRC